MNLIPGSGRWRRRWPPTPVFLPGKNTGVFFRACTENPSELQSVGSQRVRPDSVTKQPQHNSGVPTFLD